MKTMKRTLLLGASMFALTFGLSAQVDNSAALATYEVEWTVLHNVTQMTPALYEQMKTEWVQSLSSEPVRVSEAASAAQELELKKAEINLSRGLPADFPFKMNTGNAQADEAAFQQEKALWIQNNPGVYNQMISTSSPTAAQLEERNQVLNN